MDDEKKKIEAVLISVCGLLFILLILAAIQAVSAKTEQTKKAGENMISGSDDSHWYHIEVTVKEVDLAKKTLMASVPENDFFDSEKVQVDCSKNSVDITGIQEGDHITIYFFKSSISGNAVKAEDIT